MDKQKTKRSYKMSKDTMIELMTMTDIDELRMIRSAISDRIKEVGSAVKYELKKGDSVIVTSSKGVESGIINKINRTRAVVNMNGIQYNVPFSMITKQGEQR